MTTYRFEEIKRPARKRVPCAGGCGKKLSRSTTFSMTLNPFNKNPDGSIRTRRDIQEALGEQARQWESVTDDQWCTPCATSASSAEEA
jgi:hypothetical protein